jgi:hypothetical protein
MTKAIVGGILVLLFAAPNAMGQQNAVGSRIAAQFTGKFQDANCQLKEGHFLVSSGKTKLSSYAAASDPVIGARLLKEGNEILREAIVNKGQDKNPAAYYWLGRIAMLQGDVSSRLRLREGRNTGAQLQG